MYGGPTDLLLISACELILVTSEKCVLLLWVHIFFDSAQIFLSLAVIVGYLGSAMCLQRSFTCFPLKSSNLLERFLLRSKAKGLSRPYP